MRLDRFVAKTLFLSRNEVKKLIRNNLIYVNDKAINNDGFQVNTNLDKVCFENRELHYEEYVYYLMNKPAGYICANEDKINPTIIDYAPEFIAHKVHTVGRLDKDTTGALILTNDGTLTHKLISPKNNISKVYKVTTDKQIDPSLIEHFAKGFIVNNEFTTLPAKLEILSDNVALVTIVEGKYHQVKRMFSAFDLKVISLNRESFAALRVDDLALGEFRRLHKSELEILHEKLIVD